MMGLQHSSVRKSHVIKQYDSTVQVGVGAIVAPTTKKPPLKTILKTSYATFTE